MEDICKLCKESSEVICSCDDSLRFCTKEYSSIHKLTKGDHVSFELKIKKQPNTNSFFRVADEPRSQFNAQNEKTDAKPENSLTDAKFK